MAIYIHCPQCNERLTELRQDCPHCRTDLPPGVFYALAVALGQAPMPSLTTAGGQVPAHLTRPHMPTPSPAVMTPPPQNSRLRPWLAVVLSLACGLGQLYNGQVRKGLVLLALALVSVLTWSLGPGKVLAPLVWLVAIVDAYRVARRSVPR